jgi:hypothetical protein
MGGDTKAMAEINAAWAQLAGGEYCQSTPARSSHRRSAEDKKPSASPYIIQRELAKIAVEFSASGNAQGYEPSMVIDARGWRAEGVPPWIIQIRFAQPALVDLVSAEAASLPYAVKRAHHRAVEVHEIILHSTEERILRYPVRMAVCGDRDLALRFTDGAGPVVSLEIITHEALLPPYWKNLRIHGRLASP